MNIDDFLILYPLVDMLNEYINGGIHYTKDFQNDMKAYGVEEIEIVPYFDLDEIDIYFWDENENVIYSHIITI